MSYGFSITKDADGIRVNDTSEGALAHIPDGVFQVSGHVPSAGTSRVTTIAVTLTSLPSENGPSEFIASSAASYATD